MAIHSNICPVCGSSNIARFEKITFGKLVSGDKFSFKEIYYRCNNCNEEGDFNAETDAYYLAAQKDAQLTLIRRALDNLNNAGISMAAIERIFNLPTRTLTRWKTGDFSASAMALISIIVAYPWIIEVAENKFDPGLSKIIMIKAAVNELQNEASKLSNSNMTHINTMSDHAISGTASSNSFNTQPCISSGIPSMGA
jgi:hypothetical protein